MRTASRAVPRSSTAPTTAANAILVYLNNWPAAAVSAEDLDAFKADLRALPGPAVNVDVKDVKIELPLLADKLDNFKEVIRRMQRRIDAHSSGT